MIQKRTVTKKSAGRKNVKKERTSFEFNQLERVQKRAYEIYEERLRFNLPGDEVSDWHQAEAEIHSEHSFH